MFDLPGLFPAFLLKWYILNCLEKRHMMFGTTLPVVRICPGKESLSTAARYLIFIALKVNVALVVPRIVFKICAC